MKIISIANQKGGCGKTTTAINLVSTLAYNGKRTLLIDLDPQAHATLGLNIDDQNSLYNVISKLTPRKLNIENIIQNVDKNFDIIPSNILVGTLEQELSDEIGRELKLLEVIDQIRDNYDYILIDCPPSLGFLTVNSIRASHEVLVPVETSRFSLQGVDHLMDIITLIKDRLHHPVECKVLITMFDSRLRHSFSMLSKIKDQFSALLLDTIIHVNVKLKESAVMGQAVIKYDKYCRGSKDYFTLAKELISTHESQGNQEATSTEQAQPATKETVQEVIKEASAEPQEAQESTQTQEEVQPETQEQDVPQVQLSDRMKELVQKETESFLAVKFNLEAPEAQTVYVTGSFNDWSLDESCRMQKVDGNWQVDVDLKPGVYKYQFIVDGKWQEDPANSLKERNSFGDINSLIEVAA